MEKLLTCKSKIVLGLFILLLIMIVLLLTRKIEPIDYEGSQGTGKRAFYSIVIETEGNGKTFSSQAYSVSGDYIYLSAEADEGYEFKEWLVEDKEVIIEEDKFFMPRRNVKIKAIFEKPLGVNRKERSEIIEI